MSVKICLNAGHDGKYNRSPGVPEYYESDMNWKLHLMLKEELEKLGFVVILTRPTQDTKMGLVERGRAAKGCGFFLSLHSNAAGSAMAESVDRPVGIHFVDDDCGKIDQISRDLAKLLSDTVAEVMGTKQKAEIYSRLASTDLDGDGEKNDDYYSELWGAHQVGVPGVILEHSFHTCTRSAKWLLDENNLRKLAEAEAEVLAEYFGREEQTVRESAPSTEADAPQMWEFLTKSCGLSDVAAAGAMANWDAECSLKSTNLETRGNKELKMTDEEYTEAVDNGTYTNFADDRYGYGLCQWTHPERKAEMIAYIHGKGMSIGNVHGQEQFFWKEILGYKKLMEILASTTSVKEASDAVMTMYERPGDQSEEAKKRRSDKAQEFYDRFARKPQEEATQPVPGLPFVDVPKGAYYAEAVRWAYEKGITLGRDESHFEPDKPITRAEMVAMLYRALGGVTNEQ